MRGNLDFSYREEFRSLPEGQTYPIYLDSPAEPQVAAGSGGAKASITGKVAYFMVGAALGGRRSLEGSCPQQFRQRPGKPQEAMIPRSRNLETP